MGKFGKDYWTSEEYIKSREERAKVIYTLIADRVRGLSSPFLSVGCGPAIIENVLSKMFGKTIIGLEIDKEVLVNKTNVVIGDGTKLPFKSESFEFVMLNHVLEHVENQRDLVRKVKRVLKNGGMVYVATPNLLWPYEVHYRLPFIHWFPKKVADKIIRFLKRGRGFENVYLLSYSKIKSMFESEGFEFINLLPEMMFNKKESLRKKWWRVALGVIKHIPILRALITTHLSPQHTFIAMKV
ncbi:MAG: class I SAM-dependent methyltransferase [candidate division WOR-3 bacterium]